MRLIDADALRKRIKAKNASNAMRKAMREECVADIDDAPTIEPECNKKLNEIASALSEKLAYMNTCLNERDIILRYLGVKRSCEPHCNTDCTNTNCESHPLSSVQPKHIADDERKIADLNKMVNYLLSRLEQQWIPCSESLPAAQTEVNVSCMDDSGDTKFWYTTSGWVTTNGEYWIVDNEINPFVIAWMPLPEPYKESEADEID